MGGPSENQRTGSRIAAQNAQQQQDLARQGGQRFGALYGQTQPFYSNEMNRGLPFYNNLTDYNSGAVAQAYAPAQGDLARRLSLAGPLPSGFKTAAQTDLNAQKARTFDQSLVDAMYRNFATKQAGAQGLTGLSQIYNPAAFYGGSTSAAGQAMQPLIAAPNPWAGVLGGAVGGAASSIPW